MALLLLALLGFCLYRRRKNRVSDDFKWPELADGTGSGGTAAGLYPNPTHPTGNNRFEMDDEELFDDGTAEGVSAGAAGIGSGNGSAGGQMMSERDPSFLSSAAGSAGAGAYGGMAGYHHYTGSHPSPYGPTGSQEGHYSPEMSPPLSNYGHGQQQASTAANYAYDPQAQLQQFYSSQLGQEQGQGQGPQLPYPGQLDELHSGAGMALPPGAARFEGAGAVAGVVGLGRTGSITSTAANNYQVGRMPEYGYAGEQGGQSGPHQGQSAQEKNRLSVVNALADVGEE